MNEMTSYVAVVPPVSSAYATRAPLALGCAHQRRGARCVQLCATSRSSPNVLVVLDAGKHERQPTTNEAAVERKKTTPKIDISLSDTEQRAHNCNMREAKRDVESDTR